MHIQVIEPLITEPVPRNEYAPWLDPDTNKSRLYANFTFFVDDPRTGIKEHIVVPAGYITDWSSTPRILWRFYPPDYTEARRGAVGHDYIYSHLYWYYPKEFADRLMIRFMEIDGAGRFTRSLFHHAIRLGGNGGWARRDQPDSHPHWRTRHAKVPYETRRPVPGAAFNGPTAFA